MILEELLIQTTSEFISDMHRKINSGTGNRFKLKLIDCVFPFNTARITKQMGIQIIILFIFFTDLITSFTNLITYAFAYQTNFCMPSLKDKLYSKILNHLRASLFPKIFFLMLQEKTFLMPAYIFIGPLKHVLSRFCIKLRN